MTYSYLYVKMLGASRDGLLPAIVNWLKENNLPDTFHVHFLGDSCEFVCSNCDPDLVDTVNDMHEQGLEAWKECDGYKYFLDERCGHSWIVWIDDMYYFITD